MKINRKSLLYKYASISTNEWRMTDTCNFIGALAKSTLIIVLSLILVGILSLPLGDMIAWLVYLIVEGWIPPSVAVGAILIVSALLFGGLIIVCIIVYILNKIESMDNIRELRNSYEEKICKRIEFQ